MDAASKARNPKLFTHWSRITKHFARAYPGKRGGPERHYNEDPPLRAELFSADQMEQHGARLASIHRVTPDRLPDQLLSRLAANEDVLIETCNRLTSAVAQSHRITPAGEWLLDNFYLVEEQIRTARRHLPRGYSRELPRLAEGASAGLPRVYDIALETIAHGDGRLDRDSLSRFVAAYQTVTPLRLGELWAIPIMLRLALIENLRRVAVRIGAGRMDRDLAVAWADQLTEKARRDPKNLILVIADMARSNPPMTTPFVSELARRLQGQGPALALPLTWIEQQLAESGLSIEQLVRSGNQQQAADQVSISNSIGSLRFLGTMDWREFVEAMSLVEQTLRTDPGGAYAAMDFASRDRYRHVIEEVAKASGLSEDAGGQPRHRACPDGCGTARGRRQNGACGLLPGRPGPARAGKGHTGAPFPGRGAAALGRSIPAAAVSGHDHADHGALGRRASGGGTGGRCDLLGAGAARHSRAAGHQPACGRAGELAGHLARVAASIAAHGLRGGHPGGIARPGGGPDHAHQPRATSRDWSRRWKSGSWPIATRTCISAC